MRIFIIFILSASFITWLKIYNHADKFVNRERIISIFSHHYLNPIIYKKNTNYTLIKVHILIEAINSTPLAIKNRLFNIGIMKSKSHFNNIPSSLFTLVPTNPMMSPSVHSNKHLSLFSTSNLPKFKRFLWESSIP